MPFQKNSFLCAWETVWSYPEFRDSFHIAISEAVVCDSWSWVQHGTGVGILSFNSYICPDDLGQQGQSSSGRWTSIPLQVKQLQYEARQLLNASKMQIKERKICQGKST